MIELDIRRQNGTIKKTVINVRYIRWFDILVDSGELLIWMVGNEHPLVYNDDILTDTNILDVYKRLKILMMK